MKEHKEYEEYALKDNHVVRKVEVRDISKNNELVEKREEVIIKLPTDDSGDLKPVDVPQIEKKAEKAEEMVLEVAKNLSDKTGLSDNLKEKI